MANEFGLRVAQKPDSQEICFIPDQDHARFVREKRGNKDTAGDFVTTDGRVVGQHAGYEAFTIGQRKGLGLAFGEPRYVRGMQHEKCIFLLLLSSQNPLPQPSILGGSDAAAGRPFSRSFHRAGAGRRPRTSSRVLLG